MWLSQKRQDREQSNGLAHVGLEGAVDQGGALLQPAVFGVFSGGDAVLQGHLAVGDHLLTGSGGSGGSSGGLNVGRGVGRRSGSGSQGGLEVGGACAGKGFKNSGVM